MKVKSKVFKRKTGKSEGKWIVRIEYFDDVKGKKCFMERHAGKKSDASVPKIRMMPLSKSMSFHFILKISPRRKPESIARIIIAFKCGLLTFIVAVIDSCLPLLRVLL